MHFNTNESLQENSSEKSANKYRLYNLLFNGRISLQEYYEALRVLGSHKKEG
ncbi:hypothetical protein [Terrimonas pollutisoli]|uniref:hypothetical protein n=1 Tax=Terrimonas pollutisoli TaxID=3034147 RepID=UPI0023EB1798|nr:hypothetical protein [Terrimonas sp. H1YJ31]